MAYAEITEQWCKQAGLRKMVWNKGAMIEYWITVWRGGENVEAEDRAYYEFMHRISIRFDPCPDEPFEVMLLTSNAGIRLYGVTQPFQLQNVYQAITGRQMPEKSE